VNCGWILGIGSAIEFCPRRARVLASTGIDPIENLYQTTGTAHGEFSAPELRMRETVLGLT
jgi:hypothetical protein